MDKKIFQIFFYCVFKKYSREQCAPSARACLSLSLSLFLYLSFSQTILSENGNVFCERKLQAMFPVGASVFFTTDSPLPGLAMP